MFKGEPLNQTEQRLAVSELAYRDGESQISSGVLADTARSLAEQFLNRRREILELLDRGPEETIVAKLRGMRVCLVIIERRLDTEFFLDMNDKFEDLVSKVQQKLPAITLDYILRHVEESQEE